MATIALVFVLDINPWNKPWDAKDNSRTYLNTNQTTKNRKYGEWTDNELTSRLWPCDKNANT